MPYESTVEARNRFEGLDLIYRVLEELWTEVHSYIGGSDQDHPQEKEMQKAKWLSEEALQIAEKRRSERQKRKGKIYAFECRVPKNSKEIRKPFSVISAKKYRKTIEWERLEISSIKLELPREHSMQRQAQ